MVSACGPGETKSHEPAEQKKGTGWKTTLCPPLFPLAAGGEKNLFPCGRFFRCFLLRSELGLRKNLVHFPRSAAIL